MPSPVPSRILPVIAASQLAGTSVWFAGNAVMPDLVSRGGLHPETLGHVTTAVQVGFIFGTLVFAVLALADRYRPQGIFLTCAAIAGVANGAILVTGPSVTPLLVLRFVTGFALAGIYPVGMKIAASWFDRDLGRALGFLVGSLVIGTALPHLIRGLGHGLPWEGVMLSVSAIALLGGVLMYVLVPDGPHLKSGATFDPRAIATIFRSPDFRASSFGYFGHMWELYAFWAFAPVFIAAHPSSAASGASFVSLASFVVIGAGAIGCMVGGVLSQRLGSRNVAGAQLTVSGLCCLLSPLAFLLPLPLMLAFLLVWGITAAGDSPQFSAMNAKSAPPHYVGSALTIANCIGFTVSIVSIQLANALQSELTAQFLFWVLVPGPVLGLLALRDFGASRNG